MGFIVSSLGLVFRLGVTKAAAAVRTRTSGDIFTSNTWRRRDEAAYLFTTGNRRIILVAQGLLSFANAPKLLDETRKAIVEATSTTQYKQHAANACIVAATPTNNSLTKLPPIVLIIRCSLVADLDYAAAHTFCELRQLCDDAQVQIIICELESRSISTLHRLGFFLAQHNNTHGHYNHQQDENLHIPKQFDDFQSALKAAEDIHLEHFISERQAIIERHSSVPNQVSSSSIHSLSSQVDFFRTYFDEVGISAQNFISLDTAAKVLAHQFTERFIKAGTIIWRVGEQADSIIIVRSGVLHLQRPKKDRDNTIGHLATPTHRNSIIVEVASALSILGHLPSFANAKHQATLVASTDCDVLHLSRNNLLKLRQNFPQVALLLADAALLRSFNEYEHYVTQASSI
mmetsp:Transcript_13224/g.15998  ORF Transcript_13224/g.15998 Transcript_13224/m.15998 type:complete len:402 (-) Transcript_13224:77-1282(-)